MKPGILLVDKPQGVTSAQVVAKVKRAFGAQRVGHSGTLDPMATGLVVCFLEGTTRLARFGESGTKVYSGSIRFGIETDSDDITGVVKATSDKFPKWAEIQREVAKLTGQLSQLPPVISALKVDGVRAYARARQGQVVELQPRAIVVHEFSLTNPVPTEDAVEKVSFLVTCSKGTYIRALARDLGQALGCGACLETLRREASAPFNVRDAKPVDRLSSDDILRWDILFPDVIRVVLEAGLSRKLSAGDFGALRDVSQIILQQFGPAKSDVEMRRAIYFCEGSDQPLGLLKEEQGSWWYDVNVQKPEPVVESAQAA